jgi:hypothetical protein
MRQSEVRRGDETACLAFAARPYGVSATCHAARSLRKVPWDFSKLTASFSWCTSGVRFLAPNATGLPAHARLTSASSYSRRARTQGA